MKVSIPGMFGVLLGQQVTEIRLQTVPPSILLGEVADE